MSEGLPRVPVTYLFSRSCPSHEEGLDLLRAAADEAGVALALAEVEITSDEEAERRDFAGSPTYLVAGRDIAERDPLVPARMDVCRAYVGAGGRISPLPERAALVAALRLAANERRHAA